MPDYDQNGIIQPAAALETALPVGTASGPYALTPKMLDALHGDGGQNIRAVALSWALAGLSRGGTSEISEYSGNKAIEIARRFEEFIRNERR